MRILREWKGKDLTPEEHLREYGLQFVDYTPDELLQLEHQLHHGPTGQYEPDKPMGLDGWSLDHEIRFDGFTTRPFRRGDWKSQRIDVFSTPPSKLLYLIPRRVLLKIMEPIYSRAMGPLARTALTAYENTPAEKGKTLQDSPSIMEAIGQKALDGENGTILTSHAESLDDVGTYHGATAISLARKRSRFVKRAGVFLNVVQSREKYKGIPIEAWFKFFGKIIWTLPDTDSPAKWGISEDVRNQVFRGTLRELKKGRDEGMWLTQAPVGQGMGRKFDTELGMDVLIQENMSPATAHVISEFANFVVTAAWGDKVSVSYMHRLRNLNGMKKGEKDRMIIRNGNKIQLMLAKQTADLAQMPVVTKMRRLNGEETERVIWPSTEEAEKIAA